MLCKVLLILFILIFCLNKRVSAVTCYSCEALDKHLPMSECYFVKNTTNTTTCPSSCLFFQYIVPEEEYSYYNSDQKGNTTVKGNVAHTVRSCAPANLNESCIVNSTAVTRQCIVCNSDLCNGSSRINVSAIAITALLALVLEYSRCVL